MLILAVDTTGSCGSLALVRAGDLLECVVGDPSVPHSRRLPGEIVRLLERHALTVRNIDLYAVAAGPGSFTGLRVGIATVQGLALANDRKVMAVSALAALAHATLTGPPAVPGEALVGAWMDAQRGEVFSALYRQVPDATGREIAAREGTIHEPPGAAELRTPFVGTPDRTLAGWADAVGQRPIVFVGDGAVRFREFLAAHVGDRLRLVDPTPPLAPAIARMAAPTADAGGGVPPHAIRPVYVRRPDAEIARERQTRAVGPVTSTQG